MRGECGGAGVDKHCLGKVGIDTFDPKLDITVLAGDAADPRVEAEVNRTGLVGVSIVWKRGWTHAEGHHAGEADDSALQP